VIFIHVTCAAESTALVNPKWYVSLTEKQGKHGWNSTGRKSDL